VQSSGRICGTVSHLSYYVFFSGVVLETVIACRLFGKGHWRQYPLFAFYVAYVLGQALIGFTILQRAPNAYPTWFWRSGIAHVCLRFLVVWEVFRHAFPRGSPLRRMVSRQSTVGAIALVSVLTGMLWAIETYGKSHSVYLAMERSFGFVQAVLVLSVLTLARYYHVRVGRNIWGIAVAFGMYSSLSTVASALADLVHPSSSYWYSYWGLLGPFSFAAMLAMWTWAVWIYAPNPIAAGSAPIDPTSDFGHWSESWGQASSAVRKAMRP
jgi:hypothetical protein